MNYPKSQLVAALLIFCGLLTLNCLSEQERMTRKFTQFLKEYENKVIPLSKEVNLVSFQASITGEDSLYKKSEQLQFELSKIFTNKQDFALLKEIKESNTITDPILQRQLDIIYLAYLGRQLDEEKIKKIIEMQTDIEKRYNTFRAIIDGQSYTDNQVEEILQSSTNSKELENAWKASKEVGKNVAEDVLKLVYLRNEAARELGFDNFHTMQLQLSEQDPQEIEKLFDELDNLTRDAFAKVKEEVDRVLSKKYGITPEQMQPWHYQNRFFQEAPKIYSVDLDHFYKNKDLVEITRQYYRGIGLPIDDLIAQSDLFEKEGKYQHAYCTDINREGDVRVVCNVKPNYQWMNTLLHEYGHAVYDKFNDRSMPWTLRGPAHTFTTEAIAMLFGSMASNPYWLRDVLEVPQDQLEKIAQDCFKALRLETLVFSRWAQVMYHFEKSMYTNPDQDLNKLWWDLVEKYQMIKRPAERNEPDWAAKIHIALYPAYYHNYLMGNILASQFYYTIGRQVLKQENVTEQSFANHPEVGQFFDEKIFKPGARYGWNEMIEQATGEKLTAKYYAIQYVE
jgi:peptidyl-dipeptidase A